MKLNYNMCALSVAEPSSRQKAEEAVMRSKEHQARWIKNSCAELRTHKRKD